MTPGPGELIGSLLMFCLTVIAGEVLFGVGVLGAGMRAQAQAGIALVVGVDRLLDMVRTCVNVTCQLVGVGYVARAEGELLSDNSPLPNLSVAAAL